MRTALLAVLGAALLAAPSRAADLYRISILTTIGSGAADAATSWGAIERNRLLAGPDDTFRYRGLALKAGLTTGTLCATRAMSRKHRRWATVINFAATGLYTYASIHNARLR